MNRDQAIAIVFDDHQLFADSFSSLIERMDVFRSVHAFSDERVLIQYLIKHSGTPLCLFLDFYLQDKNALPLINEIKRLNKRSVIIVVSSVTNPIAVANILDYTPNGLISKSSGFDTILSCLQAIGQGEQFVCPVLRPLVARRSQDHNILFSPRELEILQCCANGMSISEIADHLSLSTHTIVAHRRNMMNKASVRSVTALLAFARRMELI
jgi:DNA-binding NarL/FixJ family response regulator